jgi:hypothetical protein
LRKAFLVPLLVITVLLMSACMAVQGPNTMEVTETETVPQPTPMIIKSAGLVPRLTLDEAKEHFDNGTAIFIDTRSQAEFDREHIAGAIYGRSLSASELVNTLPKDQLVITYCT